MQPNQHDVDALIQTALEEDLNGSTDITAHTTINADQQFTFRFNARHDMVVCGLDIARQVLEKTCPNMVFNACAKDGDKVEKGTCIAKGEGNARGILTGERTALNLLQYLTGIATETRRYVDKVQSTNAQILDTRKTLPGYRRLAKYAVVTGGGANHRMGLFDMVLIKDNHIALAGSVVKAIHLARHNAPAGMTVEVECDTIEQVEQALSAAPDIIMLDNMTNEQMKTAVKLIAGRTKTEASGNVSLETVADIANTGVDYISIGKLTHSVKAADIGLDVGPPATQARKSA